MKTIKLISQHKVAENPWLTLYFDEVEFPNGTRGHYNRIDEGNGRDGIVIIPIDAEGRIGLVHIYRYPIGEFSWEIPRGFGESASPVEDAAREFREEMQMTYREIQSLGYMHANTGLSSSKANIVVVRGLEVDPTLKDDDQEPIREIRFFSLSEISELCRSGYLNDGFTLAALMKAHLFGISLHDAGE